MIHQNFTTNFTTNFTYSPPVFLIMNIEKVQPLIQHIFSQIIDSCLFSLKDLVISYAKVALGNKTKAFFFVQYSPDLCYHFVLKILSVAQNSIGRSVPTDRRSFRTSPKKFLEDRSIQDLKIAKRTSKDLFFQSRNYY